MHGKNNRRDSMGLFDVDDEKLQALYKRAWLEANRDFVDFRKYPYLMDALELYVKVNGCSLDQALIVAKTGKRTF